ncbi:uncharacterized protein ACN427_002309 isoform 2-T2 [Glossina fuscipes fuscipes]
MAKRIMDRKHAMLYPDSSTIPVDERRSASASIGLPTEAPPSYDVAIGTIERNNTPETGCLSPVFKSDEEQSSTQENSLQIRDTQPNTNNTRNAGTSYQSEASTATTEQTSIATPSPQATLKLGPDPSNVNCPTCGVSKISRMTHTPNSRTHISALILCLIGWCCCACIVPYFMNSCRTGNHYCGNCNAFLGTYTPETESKTKRGRRRRRRRR